MKQVVAQTIESIHDYELITVDRPSPASGEVLIRVSACGMGYVDALVAVGGYQVKPPVPFTPGQEMAGTVVALGDHVQGFSEGDRVMINTFGGGLSEFVAVPISAVTRLPDRMTFAQAAGFRTNFLTALHGLKDRANLQAGERLLVLGAGGGVGSAAIQIGRILGAEVIAAGSTEDKRAFAIQQGAHKTMDTNPDGWRDRLKAACGGKGPDVVFDPVCGPLFEPAFRSLAWGGRHLVVGFVGGPIPKLPANLSLMKGGSLVGVDVRQFAIFEQERAQAHTRDLLQWVDDGRLVPPTGRIFPLEQFAAAMEFAMSGQGTGKTIIQVSDNG